MEVSRPRRQELCDKAMLSPSCHLCAACPHKALLDPQDAATRGVGWGCGVGVRGGVPPHPSCKGIPVLFPESISVWARSSLSSFLELVHVCPRDLFFPLSPLVLVLHFALFLGKLCSSASLVLPQGSGICEFTLPGIMYWRVFEYVLALLGRNYQWWNLRAPREEIFSRNALRFLSITDFDPSFSLLDLDPGVTNVTLLGLDQPHPLTLL